MDVLVPNLHEYRTAFGQQVSRDRQSVAEVCEVGVDPVPPRVPERLDLLRFPGDVFRLAVLHVPARGGPLEVRVELDAVGRVEVDALHLAAKPFALRQRRHHLHAVAEDHPIGPVGVVLVELGAGVLVGQPVEVGEKVGLEAGLACRLFRFRVLGLPEQVGDQRLRMHLLLDEERRRLNRKVRPVLLVLAAPYELRVEIAVASFVLDLDRPPVALGHHGFVLGGGDVPARCLLVGEGFYALRSSFRHCVTTPLVVPQRSRNCASSFGMSVRIMSQTTSSSIPR